MTQNAVNTIHRWWQNKSAESYWLEVTDRADIGINLKAPQTNEHGNEFWSYSLLKFVEPKDVIFHYDRNKQAITSRSLATGIFWEDSIVWAARGAYTREAGIQPHTRPGYYLGLEKHKELDRALSLSIIRDFQGKVISSYAALKLKVGEPLYFPFEIGEQKRPIRPMQGYLFKLPSFFVDIFRDFILFDGQIAVRETRPQNWAIDDFGAAYRTADEATTVGSSDPFSRDPALIERALRGHAATQNGLAAFLMDKEILPRSPMPTEPDFDLAWIRNGEIWVAEIKSITNSNEEKQLRLGLGQVLRYCQLLRSRGQVHGVLVLEHRPSDTSWVQLCDDCGILLIWPENWETKLMRKFKKTTSQHKLK